MTKKDLLELKRMFLVSLLYNEVEDLFLMEASRGVRPDVRNRLEAAYNRFETENEQLKPENKISSKINLKISA